MKLFKKSVEFLITLCATLCFLGCTSLKNETIKSANPGTLPAAGAPDLNLSFQEKDKTFGAKIYRSNNSNYKNILVVVVHEWWGANDYAESRARMLANEGFDTAVVDLYGNNVIVETPPEAMALSKPFYENSNLGIERLKKFLKLFKNEKTLKNKNIVAIGYCFGGTQVLNLARSGAKLKAVASFHGGLVTADLKMKKTKTEVLVFHGNADPMVPPKDVESFKKELEDSKTKLSFYGYPDALHAFTNPKATTIGQNYSLPIAYDANADQDSWKKLITFLKGN